MDSLLAVKGKDFVLLGADCNAARSILVFKADEDKIHRLNDRTCVAAGGPQGECSQFVEYIEKNISLDALRSGVAATTKSIAHFTRRELADALRSRGAYQVNLLLAGYDDSAGASLYWLDNYSSMQKLDFGCHGMCASFVLSIFDRLWRENLNLEQCKDIMRKCLEELRVRFLVHQPKFIWKVVDANGIRVIEL
eukprot:GSMAST32.ASY1.ANO1.1845.1 assembled CDS